MTGASSANAEFASTGTYFAEELSRRKELIARLDGDALTAGIALVASSETLRMEAGVDEVRSSPRRLRAR